VALVLAVSLVGVPVVSLAISALPMPGSLLLRALLGFLVTLVAMGGLVAVFVCFGPRPGLLLGLLLVGLVTGWGLSAAGFYFAAAPLKVIAGLSLGTLLGREITERWWLLAAAGVALAVDMWSVFAGPTKAVVEGSPGLLNFLLVHFPAFGVPGPATALGTSDFVFVGLFAAGARRTGLGVGRSLAVMLASLPLTLLLAVALGRPLPALPLLCLAFIGVNARDFYTRRVSDAGDADEGESECPGESAGSGLG
jgi:hypothetical protein